MEECKQVLSEQIISKAWQDYQLLDSGLGRKLEQFGPHCLIRPEPRAVWKPGLPAEYWAAAAAEFVAAKQGGGGKWKTRANCRTAGRSSTRI